LSAIRFEEGPEGFEGGEGVTWVKVHCDELFALGEWFAVGKLLGEGDRLHSAAAFN
jgi:hypothetical protein